MTSGVPQGSVLGPILFIIYVNDLPEVVQSKLWMFADDTKIYHTISSNEDSILLQNDLSSIMKRCSTWLMDLNYDKCKCMSVLVLHVSVSYSFALYITTPII